MSAARDAVVGQTEVWAVTPTGVSNPRFFAIDRLPHLTEREPNDTPPQATVVKAPVVVDGVASPNTDRDCFRFTSKAGKRWTIVCRSRSLDGTLDPTLTVIDPDGHEIEHYDGALVDARLHFKTTKSGDYTIAVQDRAYRDKSRNSYSLTITDGPYVVAAMPPMLERGKSQRVTLYGYALPKGTPVSDSPDAMTQIEVDVAAPETGDLDGGGWTPTSAVMCESFAYRHPQCDGSLRLGLVDGAVTPETHEPNDRLAQAQQLALPCDVAGQFITRNDIDWYRFTAKKGEIFWIEGIGQRLGQPMDLDIAVHASDGKLLVALADDMPSKAGTRVMGIESFDPAQSWQAPEDGDYYLAVRDLYNTVLAGVDRRYHLSIGPVHQQVQVLVLAPEVDKPQGLAIVRGGETSLPLYILRRGKPTAPIRVRLDHPPEGVTSKELTIGVKDMNASLVINADKDAPEWTGVLHVFAETELDRRKVTLPIRPTMRVTGDNAGVRLSSAVVATIVEK
jgi:hypothetical protein